MDYPELVWVAIKGTDLASVRKCVENISSNTNMKQLLLVSYSDDYIVQMEPTNFDGKLDIWNLLLDKLDSFMENRPNENVVLCEIFLKLLAGFKLESMQTLQWAIYILRINQAKMLEKNKQKSKKWSEKLDQFKK